MASPWGKRLALKVFALRRNGQYFSPDVLQSARMLADGGGTSGDTEKLRKALGIGGGRGSGGGSGAGGVAQGANHAFDAVSNISTNLELMQTAAQRGASTTVPAMRLVRSVTKEVEGVLKTKWVNQIVQKVSTQLFRSPVAGVNMMQGITKLTRIGGGVIAAAMLGVDTAQEYFDQQKQSAQQRGSRKDRTSQLNHVTLGAQTERDVEHEVMNERGATRRVLDWMGFTGGTEEAISERHDRRLKLVEQSRKTSYQYINQQDVLAEVAQAKGKRIDELTQEEVSEHLDNALREKNKGAFNPSNYWDDPWVQSRLDQEFGLNPANPGVNWVKKIYRSFTNDYQVRHRELMLQRAESRQKEDEAALQARIKQAEMIERNRTPAERQARRLQEEWAQAESASFRSRHKAWSNN